VYLLALTVAALASLLITPRVVQFAVKRGYYDAPSGGRRIHDRPVPRLGGVAVVLAMAVGLIAAILLGGSQGQDLGRQSSFLIGLFLGGGVLFTVGLVDDLKGMSAFRKLGFQALAAGIVYLFGFRVEMLSLGFGEIHIGWLSLPLTVLWIVGVTNAFNLIDGLDGLATGVALVALGTVSLAAIQLGNMEVAVVCAALVGALLGFLRYNFNPARIFLGDSGSLLIGFMLAVLSVHGSLKSTAAVLTVVPLAALALPLLDTGLAVGRRWLRGVPLFGPDARHIHHQLLASGWSHRGTVLALYFAAGLVAIVGLTLAFGPPNLMRTLAFSGGAASLMLFAYGLKRLAYHEFSIAGAVLASGPLRMRRVIKDNIIARDLCDAIVRVESLSECNMLLHGSAEGFGFVQIKLCRESSNTRPDVGRRETDGAHLWKLDFPVGPLCESGDPMVLRIWGTTDGFRPHGAERVARILAASLNTRVALMEAEAPRVDWPANTAASPLSLIEDAVRLPPVMETVREAGSRRAISRP
jgi:UDP-GlcNAc:undecaprenyl-phosphate/decaprenyl-phosphate GlcNAc-1-phosphate transferase